MNGKVTLLCMTSGYRDCTMFVTRLAGMGGYSIYGQPVHFRVGMGTNSSPTLTEDVIFTLAVSFPRWELTVIFRPQTIGVRVPFGRSLQARASDGVGSRAGSPDVASHQGEIDDRLCGSGCRM